MELVVFASGAGDDLGIGVFSIDGGGVSGMGKFDVADPDIVEGTAVEPVF